MPDHRQWTQEFRLTSNNDGAFNWMAGFFYFNEKIHHRYDQLRTLFGGDVNGEVLQKQKTKAYAFFGSEPGTFQTNGGWARASAIRMTKKTTSRTFPFAPVVPRCPPLGPITLIRVTQNTWDVTANYFQNDEINWYARIATGFRAPSIQGRLLFGDTVSVAKSETSISYEGGVKMFLAGGKARVNFNVFSYKVDDAQLTAVGGEANFQPGHQCRQGQG